MSEGGLVFSGGSRLPSLCVELPPLEGVGLDRSALVLSCGATSAEAAIAEFRQRHSPEQQPWFRRYYMKRDRGSDRISIWYVWNTDAPSTDRLIGMIRGEDVAAAKVLIGNNMAGGFMTPIAWNLCEDRDGELPIEVGRFDVWDLLHGATPDDLERFARDVRLEPNVREWDFDKFYLERTCPGCGTPISVNSLAFNIDSAQCAKCGIRPFLSRALGRSLRFALPGVTGTGFHVVEPDQLLLSAVSWMSHVGASVANLHREELPEGVTPHLVLKQLLASSRLLVPAQPGSGFAMTVSPAAVDQLMREPSGANLVAMAGQAANVLADAIRDGGPFTEIHSCVAALLRAIEDDRFGRGE